MRRTLEVAIQQYKELGKQWRDRANTLDKSYDEQVRKGKKMYDFCDEDFKSLDKAEKMASECEELVEWLSELREIREENKHDG